MRTTPHPREVRQMSPCVQFRSGLVTDYLEHELAPALRDRVEFHLLTCADCAELLHTHRHVAALLRGLGPVARH